jgi:fructose-1,6-bisphosphatase/inositol monophosphatase family enzyme
LYRPEQEPFVDDALFDTCRERWRGRGEPTALVLAMLAEALDTVRRLRGDNTGAETVRTRSGAYKSWDPDILRVDKEVEDGFLRRLRQLGVPLVLLSEEAGRVAVGDGDPAYYAVADPFDGSWLFQRGIPAFWYSSMGLYDAAFEPVCCAVGDAVRGTVAFADADGAWLARPDEGPDSCEALDEARRTDAVGASTADPARAGIESYAMKPARFLLPLVDRYRPVIEAFKFLLPNGGPYGFADVALGRVDVYFAPGQPFVDVFSGLQIAERAGAVVTDFEGGAVRPSDDVETVLDVVASRTESLHERVLGLIAECRQEGADRA